MRKPVAAAAVLPSPDFTFVPGVTPLTAGLRPYRKETFRLEGQLINRKLIVHNYGHGGAGITMSWGCAQEVVNIITARHPRPQGKPVAVLGAGVMGLTAATLLAALRMDVTVYAKAFIPHTTSNVAGGQWAPSKVEFRPSERRRFQTILRNAFNEHVRRGAPFGVSRRTNYSVRKIDHFNVVPADVVPAPTELKHLPFEHLNRRGFAYKTLLVEPPIFLSKLYDDLKAANVRFVQREFLAQADVLALPPSIIVNCTGLGSDSIWRDTKLVPIKGQLVLLPAQPRLEYLFSGSGYLFPRKDCTVVGGTEEYGFTDVEPDPARCAALVKHLKDLFAGAVMRKKMPTWLIQNE